MSDSTTSDFTSTTDLSPIYPSQNPNKISYIIIFLMLILIILLVVFYFKNLSKNDFTQLNTESELKKTKAESETHKKINKDLHPEEIKRALNLTNQELNKSINELANLINTSETQNNNEIKTLEKNIEELKSEVIILQSKLLDQELNNTNNNNNKPKIPNINISSNSTPPNIYNNYQDDVVIYDPIANYDRLKLTDPLVDPRGRSSADQIPTPQVAAQLNFPTQGVIDRYHRVGLLIALNNDFDDGDKYKYKNSNKSYNKLSSNNYNTTSNDYNGIQVLPNSSGSDVPSSIYSTSSDVVPITTLKPKSVNSKTNRKNKNKKRKNKKEHFGIEGFETNSSYETFDLSDDETEDDDFNSGDNFTILENSVIENFGGSNSQKRVSVNTSYDDNNILELIGKKITDNWYKYFTSISIGNKIIKINVHNRNRRELYDGDIVYIPELGKDYRVQIDKMDMIEYNPYFF